MTKIPITVWERIDHLGSKVTPANFKEKTDNGSWIEHTRSGTYLVTVVNNENKEDK